jgi:DNA polymerase-1
VYQVVSIECSYIGGRPVTVNNGKLLLIDGNSLMHRAFHALPTMTTSTGQHTNAVYGFTTMLMRLLEEEQPAGVAVAFDRAAPTFRHLAYDDYKVQRPPMAEELASQIPLIRELVQAFELPIVEIDGYEADDVLGTLAVRGQQVGYQVVIVTGDKDALQLVQEGITVLITRKGISEMDNYGPKEVEERFGIQPTQVVDFKALMGDPSDNIPGVSGIGEKTATKLLQQYHDLATILTQADQIKGKVGEALRTQQEVAKLSQELATIITNVPVDVDLESLRWYAPNLERATQFFKQIESVSLLRQFEKRFGTKPDLSVQGAGLPGLSNQQEEPLAEEAPSLFANPAFSPVAQPYHFRVVETPDAFTAACDQLPEPLYVVAAIESASVMTQKTNLFAVAHDQECVVGGPAVAEAYVGLLRSGKHVVGHNLKQQIVGAALRGVTLPNPEDVNQLDDLQLASYLVNPTQGDHSLTDLALQHGYAPPVDWPKGLTDIAHPSWYEPLQQRLDIIKAAEANLRKRLKEDGLEPLYRNLEMPLLAVLTHMEATGVRVDKEQLAVMSKELASDLKRLTQEIYAAAGTEFNINSPKQLADILFNRLKLPVLMKTKSGPSTAAQVLEELAGEHALPGLLLDYRKLTKLTGTYIDALPQVINPQTGRIHTTFHQTIAATGRLSSADPNLQNIPVRSALGRQVRSAFVASNPDAVLISADYSQIELRVLAHLSGDDNLIQAFVADADIHTKTAAEVFGVEQQNVTPEMRNDAKAINFGIVYGISSFGLARGTGLTRAKAQEYINGYFARYPRVKAYMEEMVALGRAQGYVTTILGRRRYLPELSSRRWQERSFAERTAMNTPIQGSAADIIKLAMVRVHTRLRDAGLDAQMVLQVHDELVVDTPREQLDETVAIVREELENAYQLKVPLKVDVSVGTNWLDMQSYKE